MPTVTRIALACYVIEAPAHRLMASPEQVPYVQILSLGTGDANLVAQLDYTAHKLIQIIFYCSV